MASVTNLKNGSSGSEVKKLQQALIKAGYDVGKTGADGVLGKNTEAAIKKYQKDNGLAVDGIAGKNTQGLLYGTSINNSNKTNKTNTGGNTKTGTNTGSNKVVTDKGSAKDPVAGTPKVEEPKTATNEPVTSPAGFTYGDFSYASWNPQDDPLIQQANALLQEHINSKPGEWVDPYKDTYMGYLSQYENRDPFSYDFNSDALYNQYKDQYIQQGQLAMMDTMGQAQAMTGGYGSSYAQTVGQQAYNQQLGQLNEIMPELYGMAYDRYNQEGQNLLDMYSAYLGLSEQDYNKHQNNLNNWYTQLNYLTDSYNTEYSRGYDDYLLGYNNAWSEYSTDRAEEFDKWQTTQSQEFTASENEKNRQFETEEAEKDRTWKESQATTSTDTEVKEVKYNTLDYEQQAKWGKEFEKEVAAKSVEGVDDVADRMVDAGFDPQIVARWRDKYAQQITGKPVVIPQAGGSGNSVGGGGSSFMYAEVR